MTTVGAIAGLWVGGNIARVKKAEQKLRVLSKAVEQASEAVLITEAEPLDEPGPSVVYANPAFEEMTGYGTEEILGQTPRVLQGPETEREVLDSLREALEADEKWEGETINYRKDGTPFLLQWNVAPVTGEEGSVEYWVSVQRDVTEEREREERLRRQKTLLEQTQRLAGAWEVDLETGDMSWSDKVYRIHEIEPGTEVSVEEGIGFYAPEARPKIREAFERCIEEGEPYDLELPFITAKGNWRWVRTVGAPAEREGGEVVKVAGAFQDITERRQRERELRERERQLEQIRENITDVVWMSPADKTEIEFISEAYQDIWGRPTEQLNERPNSVVEAIHPEDRERVQAALEMQRKDPEAYAETYRVVQPDGEIRWVRDRAAGVYDEDGQLERIIGVATDITGQKRREQALQERQEKMEALYEATTRLLQAETKEEVSASILNLVNEVFGYPIVAVRYVEDGRLVPVEVSPEIPEHMPERPSFEVEGESVVAEVFRNGETAVFDDLRTFEDPFDYGEVRATAIVPIGEHGSISVADLEVGTIDDFDRHLFEILAAHAASVLDRIEWEEDLREERDLLERIFETSPVAIVLFNREGDFVHASDRAEEVLGLEKEEITDRTYNDPEWSITTPDGTPIPDEELPFARVISTEEPLHNAEHTIKWPDGTQRLLSVSGAPLYTAGGELEGAVFHIEDITERRATERRLRRSEQRFRKVFTEAPIGIARVGVDGRVLETNPAFQDTLGYEADTLQGRHFKAFTYEEDVGMARDKFNALVAGEYSSYTIEKRYQRGDDGSVFWARLTASLLEQDGETQIIAMIQDIDEQKRYEETLREAKEEAEEASRLKSAMLANMSHEIRTPLTSITGFAEILTEELEGRLRNFASRIHKSGQRLMGTLDSVLQLSKLEAGAYELEREELNLGELAEETAEMLRSKAEEKSIALTTVLPEAKVQGTWNEGAVNRITENLVENAIKFTPEGGRVDLRVAEEGQDAVLEVEDTGIGIDPDEIDELFKAFKQESEGLGREYEGSGLGLSIVKRLTEELGGTIAVETEKGKGTCFTVRLPLADDSEGASEEA